MRADEVDNWESAKYADAISHSTLDYIVEDWFTHGKLLNYS